MSSRYYNKMINQYHVIVAANSKQYLVKLITILKIIKVIKFQVNQLNTMHLIELDVDHVKMNFVRFVGLSLITWDTPVIKIQQRNVETVVQFQKMRHKIYAKNKNARIQVKRIAIKSSSVDTDVLAIKLQLNASHVQNAIKIKNKRQGIFVKFVQLMDQKTNHALE